MKKTWIPLVCLLLVQLHLVARDIRVQPTPRHLAVRDTGVITPATFRLEGESDANPHAVQILKTFLAGRLSPDGIPLRVGQKGDRAVRSRHRDIPDHPEAYYLQVTKKGITLAGSDPRGTYYAARTFIQLFRHGQLPLVEITDYPDVRFRGVVEGFYGTPWSHEARLLQLQFYGENKLNTYIYGPKDDPYHSSPRWREPYPEKEAARLAELVRVANRNEVDFVWAIHPGKDIRWDTADRDLLLDKFQHMYDLGVRSFAVFFDDISGEGAKADRQAELLNYIDDHFVHLHPDITPLIVCPTEYNKSWVNLEGGYLTTLGEKLNPSIHVMWTGDRVIATIDREGVDWVRRHIRRPAYIWWNFPVSDYVRDHLLLGQVYGNGLDIADAISGFVANPMEFAEASKIAIYCVADYTWNMAAYDPARSWQRAIPAILPGNADALAVFARHNSDLGDNVHGFRREESVDIRPVAERFARDYRDGQTCESDYIALRDEFERVAEAADLLLVDRENEPLIREITPWLYQFKLLGDAGRHVLALVQATRSGDSTRFLRAYRHVRALREQAFRLEQQFNQNPYQPGVKTATAVLQPLVRELFTTSVERFNREHGTDLPALADYSPCTFTTDVPQLATVPLQVYPNRVHVTPLLEVLKWPSGASLHFAFDNPYIIPATRLNLGVTDDITAWARLEASPDGHTWHPLPLTRDPRDRWTGKWDTTPVRFLRLTNISPEQKEVYLREFYILFQF